MEAKLRHSGILLWVQHKVSQYTVIIARHMRKKHEQTMNVVQPISVSKAGRLIRRLLVPGIHAAVFIDLFHESVGFG